MTPGSFLAGTLALFVGLAAAATLASYSLPLRHSVVQRASFGAGAAAVLLGGLAYVLVAKGAGLGRLLVQRPLFVPAARLAGRELHAAEADAAAVEMTRIKTA